MLTIAASVGLLFVVAVVAFLLSRDSNGDAPSEFGMMLPAIVAAEPLDASIPRNGRILGNPDAPVTIVEWADYQCPFCGAFGREIVPRIIQDFVVTGQVRIDFRDLPFLDSTSGYGESDMAAEAAACAGDQGKFWEYHDTIFANQFGENEGAYSNVRLTRMAELNNLDMTTFSACFEGRAHQDEVRAMQAEAVANGITSTPTLVINGAVVRYTGKYEDLKAEIDAVLASI